MNEAPSSNLVGKLIVVISVHYWPEETGIGPYATGTAEHLASMGARVTVLTTMPFYPQWKTRAAFRRLFFKTEVQQGVEVRRIRQYVPSRQTAAQRMLYEFSFLVALFRAPWRSRPDTVIGVIPSLSSGITARLISTIMRVPYGIIVQDLSGQAALQSGISGGSRLAKFTSRLEGAICRGAKRVAVVAPAFRKPLTEMGVRSESIVEIRNWTHVQAANVEPEVMRAQLGWEASDFVVLHAGNMGLKQGLEHLIDAAAAARSELPGVRFVLMGDGNQRAFLETTASGLSNVTFMDPVSSSSFTNVLSAADVLLVHERSSVTDMSLPSKLTSYFAVGRPILAAVNPLGATAHEITRASAGRVIPSGDARALIMALRGMISDKILGQTFAAAATNYAAEHLSRKNAESALGEFAAFLLNADS